jgi:hypothetical protein
MATVRNRLTDLPSDLNIYYDDDENPTFEEALGMVSILFMSVGLGLIAEWCGIDF